MTTTNTIRFYLVALGLIALAACGREDAGTPTPQEATAEATDNIPTEVPSSLPQSASPEGARLFFITPADGDTVANPVRVEFGLEGMSVVAAGVDEENAGHHHLLVDTGLPDLSLPIPADASHIHFGDASTSTELTLAPGEHTLQLLLGNHLHIPHDPPVMSEPITITVE